MSTQSGIVASKELLDSFKEFQGSSLVIKLSSDNTELVPDHEYKPSVSIDLAKTFTDLHSYVSKAYPHPSYIVIANNDVKNDFIFISFIPDEAPIRQKMLYASTKNTLINSLGSGNFAKNNTFSWTELEELSIKHYEFAHSANSSKGLLTSDERDIHALNALQDLSLAQQGGNGAYKRELASMHGSRSETPEKVLFNLDDELKNEFDSLPDNSSNKTLVTFNIKAGTETLTLTSSKQNVAISSLISTLENVSPEAHPSYSIYNYYEGKFAFIYSCPSGSKVKDRMIYASTKLGLINHLKSTGLVIDKSLEVGDLDELELSELEQKDAAAATEKAGLKFTKPKGPRRR